MEVMPISLFARGLLIGFSIAAPVGPIGILCIRRTLAQGWSIGLASGLGAASADAIYGSISALGITVLANFLVQHQVWFSIIGGLFLAYLGLKTLGVQPHLEPVETRGNGILSAYGSTFILTLTNPMTILSFTAIYAALGLGSSASRGFVTALPVLGIFTGSALWWIFLSGGISLLRRPLPIDHLRWINRLSGVILVGFAIFSILRLF